MKHILMTAVVLGVAGGCMAAPQKTVVVWSEGTAPTNVYPNDINAVIAAGLRAAAEMKDWNVVVANLSDPEQGLPDTLLAKTDVLVWWGHKKHGEVKDELASKIAKRVKEEGMGFIALHSAHFAKPNKLLMGTACTFAAYVSDNKETVIKVTAAEHPIAKGVAKEFTIENEERYSDPYAVPPTTATPLGGTHLHKDGVKEESIQGYCWTVGKGNYFYFQAGHETNPIYFQPEIRKIMANAVLWAARK
ncbi:MAG: ThuA domain-containing protein [Verrucomicrobia bacterium]|nr:ThuA domain-containing protein [Verrucomicrobiota bacterium]